MPVRSPGQTTDILLGADHGSVVLTTANDTELHSWLVPVDGRIIAWGHQVTTTVVSPDFVPTVILETTDYDDAANTTIQDTVTIPAGTVAANTVVWRNLNFGNGVAVTAGQHIRFVNSIHAHDAGGAGAIVPYVIYRPGS